jgi:hypothetical protein
VRDAVRQTLQRWQENPDLAGLREAAAPDRLPAAERAAWEKLWAEAEARRKKCGAEGAP